MATDHCDISCTWNTDNSFSAFTSYKLTDCSSDDIIEESKNYDFQDDNFLHLVKDEGCAGHDNQCILHLICLNHDCASIHGLAVISESRTLEVSNDTDGYLTTVRGKRCENNNSSNAENVLYFCKCTFEEGYTNLNVKFLSLGEKTSFRLYSLVVSISCLPEDKSHHTRGTLNINKLKKDVHAMGDAVSDRAKELLSTMEQFKQNKLKNFEDIMAFQQHAKQLPQSSPAQDLSTVMSCMLQTGALKSLIGGSITEKKDADGRGLDMYKMLQMVCGNVTSMRAAATSREQQIHDAAKSPDSCLDSVSHDIDDEKHPVNLDEFIVVVEQKINQVKAELQTEIRELKREIIQHNTAAAEMNEKLDKIMCMLRDLQGRKEESPPKSKTYQDYL